MAITDTISARIEEASHAVVNLLTTKQYTDDRFESVHVGFRNGHLFACVVGNPDTEITGRLWSMIPRGNLLDDINNENIRSIYLNRIIAKSVMVVAGHAGVDLHQRKSVQHLLNNYTFQESWYEKTVKGEAWALRDSDKALLLSYFVQGRENRVIPLGSPIESDFLKPISNAYTSDSVLRDAINEFVSARTDEAVLMLNANWDAVLKLADELDFRSDLTVQEVLGVLGEFPNVVDGI